MNGLLRDHPLAELAKEISAGQLSGALRLSRERVRGAVYFEAGEAVFAVTNLRASRLAECLRRWGAVAPERLGAVAADGMSDEELGAALVAAGALTRDGLERLRARQASEALLLMLQWADGEWGFDPRVRLGGEAHVPIDAAQLLVEGARRLPPEFVAHRLGNDDEQVTPGDATTDGLSLLPAEGFVLTRLEGPMRVGDLLAACGLPGVETRRALYALLLCGLARRERWPIALRGASAAQTKAPPSAAAGAQKEGAQAAPTPTAPTTTPAAASSSAVAEESAKPEPPRDPREELDELFARADAQTHYQALGVSRAARPEEVKRAYYALARRFHPDRLRRDVDEQTQPRVELAFGKLAQAYEVLKDSATRAAYDLKIGPSAGQPRTGATPPAANASDAAQRDQREAAPKRDDPGASSRVRAGATPHGRASATGRADAAATVAPPADAATASTGAGLPYRAEEKFQQGLAALQQDNVPLAIRFLGEAALLVPRQARYRAHYGRALARDRQHRRQAEAELQAAIALDERNVSYRVMLAELYRDSGLRRRAEGELERALALDPKHAAARRLMDALRGRG